MFGKKQLLCLVLLLPVFSLSLSKLSKSTSDEIKSFALFNYDNLIADAYESEKSYIKQLAFILSQNTKQSQSTYFEILNSTEICTQDNPINYMMALNKKVSQISGYFFVDE